MVFKPLNLFYPQKSNVVSINLDLFDYFCMCSELKWADSAAVGTHRCGFVLVKTQPFQTRQPSRLHACCNPNAHFTYQVLFARKMRSMHLVTDLFREVNGGSDCNIQRPGIELWNG